MSVEITRRSYSMPDLPEMIELINWFVDTKIHKDAHVILTQNKKFKDIDGRVYCYAWDEYEIEIDAKLTGEAALTTVAHELVHVGQYASGRLRDVPSGARFEGKLYRDSLPYEALAYETEAHEQESLVLKEFKNRKKD